MGTSPDLLHDPTDDITRKLMRGTLKTLGLTVAVVVPAAGLLAGKPAVYGAVIGVGFVGLLFAGSAALLTGFARSNPRLAIKMLVGGAFARLVIYAVVLLLLADAPWVSHVSLAVSTGVALAITMTYELHALSRMPRLFWMHHTPRTRPVPSATRSTLL